MAELQQANKRAMFARISRMCTRGFARPSSVSNPLLLYAPGAPDLSLTQPGFNKAAGVIAINPFYERQGTTSARHLGPTARPHPDAHPHRVRYHPTDASPTLNAARPLAQWANADRS